MAIEQDQIDVPAECAGAEQVAQLNEVPPERAIVQQTLEKSLSLYNKGKGYAPSPVQVRFCFSACPCCVESIPNHLFQPMQTTMRG
jgi:hypothetical protein